MVEFLFFILFFFTKLVWFGNSFRSEEVVFKRKFNNLADETHAVIRC